jgi:hypothetical protein
MLRRLHELRTDATAAVVGLFAMTRSGAGLQLVT